MKKEAANLLLSAEYDLETAGTEPPRSHDLQYLLGLTGLKLDSASQEFVAELSNLSVATRYPVDFERALSDFSKERAEAVFKRTKGTFGWIKQQID